MTARRSSDAWGAASKTSLKGWKQIPREVVPSPTSGLKNFLKGMETHQSPGYGCPVLGALKNFLKGMETRLAPTIATRQERLKNFLKGMETRPCVGPEAVPRTLKNFLKGMETPAGASETCPCRGPQKLP